MKLRILTIIVTKVSLAVLGLSFLLTSCLREGLEDCVLKDNVFLSVKTDFDLRVSTAAAADWYAINSVSVYVIDQNNKFVTSWHGGAYIAGIDYLVPLRLDKGTYRFVVWTNEGVSYTVSPSNPELKGILLMDEMTINMVIPADRKIRELIPHRHYGIVSEAQVIQNRDNYYTITIKPHTYKVNFTVKGLTTTNDLYDFTVSDNNSSHTFDNSVISGRDRYQHIRSTGFEVKSDDTVNNATQGVLNASMILLQIDDGTETTFALSNNTTGETLYTADLIQSIQQAYRSSGETLDFSRTFEFDMVITFLTNLKVSVSVNGWSYIEQEQEL